MTHRASPDMQIVIGSDPVGVRHGLRRLFALPPVCQLSEDAQGTIEIVLAEALNNIVEHAYADSAGTIHLSVWHDDTHLTCEVADTGLPMPDGALPRGDLRPLARTDHLPEGGFGWFLIRTLAQDLAYQRIGGRNLLSFRIPTA